MSHNPVVKEMLDKLSREEAKTIPGATVLTPKQQMLDVSDAQAKNPNHRVRWVNVKDPNKAQSRKTSGYERIPVEEGGKNLGDELALFRLPREEYERRVKAVEKINDERLNSHRNEMENAVLGVAKVLRDRYGIKVSDQRLFVNED